MTSISVRDVSRVFDKDGRPTLAVQDVSFEVEPGERVVLLGPSGCGKSTLLNMTAGILPCSSGSIWCGDREVHSVLDTRRIVGYMTQTETLLPWRTALSNVMLPLELQGVPRAEREDRAHAFLQLVGLGDFGRHYPRELSGGMQKRLALARTLIYKPSILLMDEPFGSLDAQTRLVLQDELLRAVRATQTGATLMFVTHDLAEALTIGQRIIVFTRRPARIKLIQQVKLGDDFSAFSVRSQPGFVEQHDELWRAIENEVVRQP